MATTLKIIGVHPVEAEEPVHLIELLVEGDVGEFDIGEVTQEIKGKPKSEWQVAYDERLIEEWEEKTRYAFFFHYLDLMKPLLTSSGHLPLPEPTELPEHLQDIEYESP
jgi:hypothetical protein